MPNNAETLINNIKGALEARKWSQSDLAAKLGVQSSAISRQLSEGAPSPKLETIERIAGALEMEPWELLQPEGAKPSPDPELSRLALIGEIVGLLGDLNKTQLMGILSMIRLGGQSPIESEDLNRKTR